MNAEQTMKMLEDHPLTKQLRAEQAVDVPRKREEAADRIKRLKEEAPCVLRELQVAEDAGVTV